VSWPIGTSLHLGDHPPHISGDRFNCAQFLLFETRLQPINDFFGSSDATLLGGVTDAALQAFTNAKIALNDGVGRCAFVRHGAVLRSGAPSDNAKYRPALLRWTMTFAAIFMVFAASP
jgi:hypothetical protein